MLGSMPYSPTAGRPALMPAVDRVPHSRVMPSGVRMCAVVTVLALSAVIPAQTVWTVTSPSGIQAAIYAASPGDILVLTGGLTYDVFQLDRGLTIRGNGATVGGAPQGVNVYPPPGQVAHLDSLNFTGGPGPWGSIGCPVIINREVRIDRCAFLSRTSTPALTVGGAQAVIVNSSITASGLVGSAVALECSQALVMLRDCTVTGSNASCHPFFGCGSAFPATDAARFLFCAVHAERTTFLGGSHATPTGFPAIGAAGIRDTVGTLWLADCTITGGSSISGGIGGTALLHTGPTAVDLRACQLIAGTPGGGTSTGPQNPTAPLLRLQLQPVWTRGQVTTLTLHGDPNTLHALFLTPAPVAFATPLVVEAVWATGATALAAGLLDSAGDAVHAYAVPNSAALEHAPVWCQGVSGSTFPLRASTLAGGVVR